MTSRSQKTSAGALRGSLNSIYRNLPNIVSILGVLPLCILLLDDGVTYLCALIVFNNIMDDLDGILAKKLRLQSDFGAGLDNVCDAFAHILIAMVVGVHQVFERLGGDSSFTRAFSSAAAAPMPWVDECRSSASSGPTSTRALTILLGIPTSWG